MRKAITNAIGTVVLTLAVASLSIAGPLGMGGPMKATPPADMTAWGTPLPQAGGRPVRAPQPAPPNRAKNVLSNNPLTRAWEGMRKRQAPVLNVQRVSQHDPLALSKSAKRPSPDLFVAAAKMSERQGHVEEARRQLQHALAIAPCHVEGLLALARLEDRQANLRAAEHIYRQAAGVNPHNPTALNDLALCLARQGKLAESAHVLQEAINLLPDKTLYRNNIATVLVELNRPQEALAHLSAVHGPAVANFNVGHLLVRQGRRDVAANYFAASLDSNPHLQAAQAALAALRSEPVTMPHAPVEPASTSPTIVAQPSPQGPTLNAPRIQNDSTADEDQRMAMPPGGLIEYPSATARKSTAGGQTTRLPQADQASTRGYPSTAWSPQSGTLKALPPVR